MAGNTEIISKGIYSRAQVSEYISVKQYMFIRYVGKKHVLVRFSNDLDVVIEGISYTVVQMNINGDVIGMAHLEHRERIKPGESFSSETALEVDEACIDVKVTVDKAVSGAYEYSVRGGLVTVHYDEDVLNRKAIRVPKLIPTKKKNKITPKTTAVAIVAIVLVILINLASAFVPIIKEELLQNNKNAQKKENVSDNEGSDDVVIDVPSSDDDSYNAE